MPEVYEGVREDLIAKHDLHGRTVRIEVVDQSVGETPRFKKLKELMEQNKVPGATLDDSHDNIYSGTTDDTH